MIRALLSDRPDCRPGNMLTPRNKPQALVVFDLDGTLLRGPTVCEVFARSLNRLPRMQEIERIKDREEIAAAREEMASWYRDVPRSTLLQALNDAQLAPGLSAGIALLKAHGVAIGIASITWRFAVAHFAASLGIENYLGTGLEDSGSINHVWPEHKARWTLELADRLRVPAKRTAAVGDSAGDYDMLGVVGVPVFVGSQLQVLQPWVHLPAANIERVARHIIDAWGLQQSLGSQET
jgi:phosphoserine phosphatase